MHLLRRLLSGDRILTLNRAGGRQRLTISRLTSVRERCGLSDVLRRGRLDIVGRLGLRHRLRLNFRPGLASICTSHLVGYRLGLLGALDRNLMRLLGRLLSRDRILTLNDTNRRQRLTIRGLTSLRERHCLGNVLRWRRLDILS